MTARALASGRHITQRLIDGARALTPPRGRGAKAAAADPSTSAPAGDAGNQPTSAALSAAATDLSPEPIVDINRADVGQQELAPKPKKLKARSSKASPSKGTKVAVPKPETCSISDTSSKEAQNGTQPGEMDSKWTLVAAAVNGSFVKGPGSFAKKRKGSLTGGVLAATALVAGASPLSHDEELALQRQEEAEEEEESEESQTLWQAAFTFLPMMWSVLTAIGAELIEAGACQYLALLLVPLWIALKSVVDFIARPPVSDGIAPPPPPSEPPFFVVVQDEMWAYAERHPVYYLTAAFGVAFAIGLF